MQVKQRRKKHTKRISTVKNCNINKKKKTKYIKITVSRNSKTQYRNWIFKKLSLLIFNFFRFRKHPFSFLKPRPCTYFGSSRRTAREYRTQNKIATSLFYPHGNITRFTPRRIRWTRSPRDFFFFSPVSGTETFMINNNNGDVVGAGLTEHNIYEPVAG